MTGFVDAQHQIRPRYAGVPQALQRGSRQEYERRFVTHEDELEERSDDEYG